MMMFPRRPTTRHSPAPGGEPLSEQTRRATRLLQMERLLHQHPQGLTVAEFADQLGYSKRTIQRDIAALESELRSPIQVVGRRYRLDPDSATLAPVRLTLSEARSLLLAMRLIARNANERDPDAASAILKLAETLSGPIAREIADTAKAIEERPVDPAQVQVLRRLTYAWAHSRTVAIRYRSQRAGGEQTTALDPYLLEPAPNGVGTYVIGYSHKHRQVRTFKVDRITQVEVSAENFEPKDLPEIKKALALGWGVVWNSDEIYDIVVEFAPAVASRVAETVWHVSQRLTKLDDGSLRMEVRLPSLLEFIPWVRSWGPDALVISPPELRTEIAASFAAAAARYAENEA